MEIKPRLFYQVVKIQGCPRPFKEEVYSELIYTYSEVDFLNLKLLITYFKFFRMI